MPPESNYSGPFFETRARHERLQLLLHLIRNAGPVLYLRGPDGAGKTLFARRVVEQLGDEIETATLDAAMHVDLAASLTALSANPGAPFPEVLQELAERPLLLLIDNSDELAATTAQVLASWHEAGGRVLLVGRGKPEALRELMEIQYVDLPPFDERESADFLRQRAGIAAPRVTEDLASAVHHAAGGQPGALLHALEGIVAETEAAARRSSQSAPARGRWPLGYWVAALLILGLLGGGLLYQDRINALFETPAERDTAVAVRPAPRPAAAPAHLPESPSVSAPATPAAVQTGAAGGDDVIDGGRETETGSPSSRSVPADRSAPSVDAPQAAQAPGVAPSPAAAPTQREERPDPLEAVMADAIAEAEKTGPAKPEAGPAPLSEVERDAAGAGAVPAAGVEPAGTEPAPVEERGPMAETREASEPRRVEVAPPAAPEVTTGGTNGDDWLKSRPPGHYTLQLVGARDRASIAKFIRENKVVAPHAIFVRPLDGRPWYSLVAGDYPDRDAAVAARARLPAALRGRDVWPRTFGSIQNLE